MSKAVGDFKADVWSPYPCWCILEYGESRMQFRHDELCDLKYAVDWMMKEARKKLPEKDKGEV